MKYTICFFLTIITFSTVQVSSQTKSKIDDDRPNIIYILADDLGFGNVSCYGADNFSTPNIDRLAKEGIRFTHCYTAPLCGPSRALILTGRYAFRTGATSQSGANQVKPTDEVMIPTLLKSAGYVTSAIGKWSQLPLNPSDFGFDDYFRFRGSGVYWNNKKNKEPYVVNGKKKVLKDDEYMPDLMHDHLVKFIAANKNRPFYIHYAMSHIHGKIQPTPDSKLGGKDYYADNIIYMDKLVGDLTRVLDSLKLRKNTLIIFMGDNGTAQNFASRSTVNGKTLSGEKGTLKEGGSLVPMIANWPEEIKHGKVSEVLIDASDILPTFTELAHAAIPDTLKIDGQSFAFQLTGKKGKQRDWVFMELGNKWWVRDDKWKLTNTLELYDMRNGPFVEKLVTDYKSDNEAMAAYNRLKNIMDQLNPAGGKMDKGDGSGKR
jgi:arylsulfatase A-like enzyme